MQCNKASFISRKKKSCLGRKVPVCGASVEEGLRGAVSHRGRRRIRNLGAARVWREKVPERGQGGIQHWRRHRGRQGQESWAQRKVSIYFVFSWILLKGCIFSRKITDMFLPQTENNLNKTFDIIVNCINFPWFSLMIWIFASICFVIVHFPFMFLPHSSVGYFSCSHG